MADRIVEGIVKKMYGDEEETTEQDSLFRMAYRRGRDDMIKELRNRGTLNSQRLATEILFLLPEAFTTAYERLFWRAFKDENGLPQTKEGESKGDVGRAKGRKSTGIVLGSETNLQVSGSGKRFRQLGLVIGNEAALGRKVWVDQKLEGLVEDIERSLRGESLRTRQCGGHGCRRMMDWKWRYCPSCGWNKDGKTKHRTTVENY